MLEARRDVWEANRLLVECNLGYLMLEKLRVLNEFGKCRDGARNIVDKLLEANQLLLKHGQAIKQSIRDYIQCALLFFKAYTLVHYLK